MKKTLSIILTVLMLFSLSTVAFAADYDQFLDRGTLGCNEYRIPSLYTLNDGSVIAAADMRYDHGTDSPNNIDIMVAFSPDGYTNWEYNVVNHFDDYADGITDVSSASFIDTAITQNKDGRIFMIVDAQPAGCGYLKCKQGTGYTTIDGVKRMLLTKGSNTNLSSFEYYIGDFEGDFAPVINLADGTPTTYSVDKEFDLYQNGKALTMKQRGSDKTVTQNIFYADAVLRCFKTTYLWLRTSDDGGKTWSAPEIITGQVKNDNEYFLGICPGKGFVTTLEDGTERIIFMVYDNGVLGWNEFENVSTIYSDDGGVTWQRGAETVCGIQVGKVSESQMVELNNGVLRLYAHNKGNYIAYADSTDGGHSWTDFVLDLSLSAHGNCMCSFIGTEIGGQKAVIGSFASNNSQRADGVIRVGFVNPDNSVNWVSTYNLPGRDIPWKNFFAYSCITELSDGNYGILFEDEVSHISYLIFSVDANGNITEVNGEELESNQSAPLNFWQKLINFFKNLFAKLFNF
ncbi:MAG: exo-alpha-sialidase [Clostridia bacterium]|nr:exo-alpha-sialidase [Clostridia bacterium]